MEVVKIKISRRPDLITGIYLKEENDWLLIKENPVDYVLDGNNLINKKFIKSISNPYKDEDFEYKVLKDKFDINDTNPFSGINLNTKDLFSFLVESQKLIGLEFESSDYSFVGRINKLNEKSFILDKFGIRGKFLGQYNISYSTIRRIIVDTDYLNSIDNYLVK